ncbi:hypothetical protein CPB86DRAFT_773049 [Serendipita vermifera]|nr:hypothetical protein CPB86DRAFT_773049 [Serendipita vermifera]
MAGLPPTIHSNLSTIFTPSCLQFRSDIAKTFSALRRVRPRVPFYRLPGHRLPTLWTLYRGLLRRLPTHSGHYEHTINARDGPWDSRQHGFAIRWHVRQQFRKHRHLTSPLKCRQELVFWHKLLEYLQAQNAEKNRILRRYEQLLERRKERYEMNILYEKELAWITRLRNRPRLTGAYMRPTYYNKPLPRLKPQPIHITMMINKRLKARQRRTEANERLVSWLEDAKAEKEFERMLREEMANENTPISSLLYSTQDGDWEFASGAYEESTKDQLAVINASFRREEARATSVFTPEMITLIKEARKYKAVNKSRERNRERRGEITRGISKRMNKRPPAHVQAKMSQEEIALDKIKREVSAGGYSGKIKQQARAARQNLTRKVKGGEEQTTER